jgi:lantibiotic modifying enzyme
MSSVQEITSITVQYVSPTDKQLAKKAHRFIDTLRDINQIIEDEKSEIFDIQEYQFEDITADNRALISVINKKQKVIKELEPLKKEIESEIEYLFSRMNIRFVMNV